MPAGRKRHFGGSEKISLIASRHGNRPERGFADASRFPMDRLRRYAARAALCSSAGRVSRG